MDNTINPKIITLRRKGVHIPCPASVEIGDEVKVERISGKGVKIHAGCKLFGQDTLILDNSELGYEQPVTVENCYLGNNVMLKGGFYREAVFLAGASMGSGSHVREGTILEEQSSASHTVGLKQTILFPWVTLGSLINFCDCLLSGGTGRKNHSEVGSSYIHFNFTPNQDKATASLLGDVPHGVMLCQPPIFLGGQGGLVGPCRLAFGTVVSAGSIVRKDELRSSRLIMEGGVNRGNIPYTPGGYQSVGRIITNNLIYIANLAALKQWYLHVRREFIGDDFPQQLFEGLLAALDTGITERIKRLNEYFDKMLQSAGAENMQQTQRKHQIRFRLNETIQACFDQQGNVSFRDQLLEKIQSGIKQHGKDYLQVITHLEPESVQTGSAWLQQIVDCLSQSIPAIDFQP